MKTLLILLLLPLTVAAEPLGKTLPKIVANIAANSAFETDRWSSYQWHYSTKSQPIYNENGMYIYEANPLLAGTSRAEFDAGVDIIKGLINYTYTDEDELYFHIAFALISYYASYRNHKMLQRFGAFHIQPMIAIEIPL